ncbi:hypothetical protein [Hyphomicrobium sp. LHD-15]|uniref:hypothetical protein n=1 Tax=Hyphomicrobium sp. LHD-15 TaxID=3072142 RepID=UPI00280F9C3A|nr:hypothetical protein [Hyphomicrobium sp. LHD-15]MDQ8699210.1 hypothetical protein [Hyphomicrobium sp. LHD-15]
MKLFSRFHPYTGLNWGYLQELTRFAEFSCPLVGDNGARPEASTPVSERIGYRFDPGPIIVRLDAFNLFDEEGQIDVYRESQLSGEATLVT